MPRKPRQAYSASLGRWGPDSPLPEEEEPEWAGPTDPYRSAAAHRPRAFPRGSQRLREESEEEEEEEEDETKMSSWAKVNIDEAQTPDPEKRQRPGWIPRLLDINPYKTIQQSSYSPPDGYSNDFEDGNSFEELFGQQYHPSADNEDTFERYQSCQQDDSHTKDVHRDKLYMEFYQQIDKEYKRERASDCVIVSISKDQAEYSTTIGHRLQDHGLVVEMIYLTSESGLTRALQEVKNDGSPFCVLVEPSNVTLCSCTVIMLHQIIKIHRNMPMEDALALIAKEFQKIFAEHEQQQRTEISHKAADLMDDYLERENFESYHVPLGIRHLLFLLSEGKHLYAEELNSISDYLKTRRNKLEGFVAETNAFAAAGEDAGFPNARPSGSALPPTLSKPPPLLPTPGRAPVLGQPGMPSPKPALLGERPMGPLLPTPAPMAGPKGKPPPLLRKNNKRSMHLNPPHKPTKRPLLGGRPGLLPTPAAQSRSSQHPWAPKRKF